MATKRYVSEQECAKIWMLHEKGLGIKDISRFTDVSTASIDRVIFIFTKTKEGKFAEIEQRFANGYPRFRTFAKEFFGVKEQEAPKEPKKQEAATPPPKDETVRYLTAVLAELQTISKLLKTLCKEVGADAEI